MKIGAIVNQDNQHRVNLFKDRLIRGMQSCGLQVKDMSSGKSEAVDILFVDPSCKEDTTIPNADKYVFFDCEDMADFFDLGPIYYTLKDKVTNYVKYNYNAETKLDDNIEITAFPIAKYIEIGKIARLLPEVQKVDKTYLCCSPTWAGLKKKTKQKEIDSLVKAKSNLDNKVLNLTFDKDYVLYNQRIDWMESLSKSDIDFKGGLVFHGANSPYSLENICNLFPGDIKKFSTGYQHYQAMMQDSLSSVFLLNPAGHERISFRTFDIMLTGSVNVSTDIGKTRAMYMPVSSLTIKDDEDLSKVLLSLSLKDKQELLSLAKQNVSLAKSLTPKKVRDDFLSSLNIKPY